mmetsp:Transcript_35510/g.91302  ORF Transcript_35510/g.91302 Transcript_35510/m.91302 type:complete len:192 (+) Transcript_35510:108-683(+)
MSVLSAVQEGVTLLRQGTHVSNKPVSPIGSKASTEDGMSDSVDYSSEGSDIDGNDFSVSRTKGRKTVSWGPDEIIFIPARDHAEERLDSEMTLLLIKTQERAVRKQQVREFLSREGFDEQDVNCARRWLFKVTFPLHVACRQGDDQMVELLLSSGADATLRDSGVRTAADVAKRYNRDGSHDAVLKELVYL